VADALTVARVLEQITRQLDDLQKLMGQGPIEVVLDSLPRWMLLGTLVPSSMPPGAGLPSSNCWERAIATRGPAAGRGLSR
jgi:hypothetical protein